MNMTMKQLLRKYGTIFAGCAIYALSFQGFFQPNLIGMGGVTGIAQVVHRFFSFLPVGGTVILLNTPLFYLGVKKQGWSILIDSLIAMATSNLLIDTLAAAITFPSCDLFIAVIFGGATTGLAMGLLMKENTTTGGTELLARLLKYRFPHLSIGRLCITVDIVILSFYSLVLRGVEGLYGIVAMCIASVVMDMVVYGANDSKMAYVISNKSDTITAELLRQDFGVTVMAGHGAWTGEQKGVVLCAFKKRRFTTLKQSVTVIDPDAFIIVCNAHEVLGQGFGVFSEDNL